MEQGYKRKNIFNKDNTLNIHMERAHITEVVTRNINTRSYLGVLTGFP